MITRKPSAPELAQLVCVALAIAGLVLLLPLGWVFLIVGLVGAAVATLAEIVAARTPTPAPPIPTEGE